MRLVKMTGSPGSAFNLPMFVIIQEELHRHIGICSSWIPFPCWAAAAPPFWTTTNKQTKKACAQKISLAAQGQFLPLP